MKLFLCIILSSFLTLHVCSETIRTPVVKTKHGPIQGLVLSTAWNSIKYSAFRSVPFAKPPVGKLRFKPPEPPNPWTEVLNATKEVVSCPQPSALVSGYEGVEDCLYMNVYTPEIKFDKGMTKKAVMVWFFGGSFAQGSASAMIYGPDYLIEQDIVLVVCNYRLGVLGFLYLDHPEAMGNAGLKDQTMVLRWVRDNIAAFGGDPDRVTIFGESAGAGAVNLHVLSPLSKGLFHRSIQQSGSSLSALYYTPDAALSSAHTLAAYLGFQGNNINEMLKFLMQVPAMELIQATNKLTFMLTNLTIPFRPTKENDKLGQPVFLGECPITLLMTGAFEKNPTMIGFTYNEAFAFSQVLISLLSSAENFVNQVRRELYLKNIHFHNRFVELLISNATYFLSQFSSLAPFDLTQRLMSKGNGEFPVYYYQLSYVMPNQFHQIFGVPLKEPTHSDDLGLLFHNTVHNTSDDIRDPVNQFRQKVARLWTNFAKYGNPTPAGHNPLGDVIWEPSGRAGLVLNINNTFKMMTREESVISPLAVATGEVLYFLLPLISCCNEISYGVDFFSIYP